MQKLSAEAYKEQMAGTGKTLTALGSYWKGRKPLILNKACVLGCLLPATDNPLADLRVFELLMGMDEAALDMRLQDKNTRESKALMSGQTADVQRVAYRDKVAAASRPEECAEALFAVDRIWSEVNAHLGTSATSIPQLVEQLGVLRFGHRPRVGDTFSGSGQIPFEAARLGCDVYASDLNPIACMLTWGAFNIVGAAPAEHARLAVAQRELVQTVQREIDALGVETDGTGWRGKVYLYCVEVTCPQTGWRVPLLPTLIVSKTKRVIAELRADSAGRCYDVLIRSNATDEEMLNAERGTVRTDGRGQDPYLLHTVDGQEHRTRISSLRGDYREEGTNKNKLRLWQKSDTTPQPDDVFGERLYCVQWMRPKQRGRGDDYEFRAVTADDLAREATVDAYIREHLADWQSKGWLPDMVIEPGDKTDEPIRTRGWTHWHHLFNPRQLLVAGLVNRYSDARLKFGFARILNQSCRLSRWDNALGSDKVQGVFDNQALNTLLNYGCRGLQFSADLVLANFRQSPLPDDEIVVANHAAFQIDANVDIFITDPPYGDAVKYEEILEFFIAWLRKNPPPEFAEWIWDSRRTLAIKGEDDDFRRGMIAAYRRMAECMPDNGLQVIMFTHQSGSIWADMANIVWASGLHVTAAWYVVTETDSALRGGQNVKGTILLVLRKRAGQLRTSRDDLAWELQDEVAAQVAALTGLNQRVVGELRDENLFADADVQMAGYAAALRVLTQYAVIDGKTMQTEAERPRMKGVKTFVDELIEFAVGEANKALVPLGIDKRHWDKLSPGERFYLKLLELEAQGLTALDNYQNFAKAFKVVDFKPFMATTKANSAKLKSAVELGKLEMGAGGTAGVFGGQVLRSALYAVMELTQDKEGVDVLSHLSDNITSFFDPTTRSLLVELAGFLRRKLIALRPEEAQAAEILEQLLLAQRLG